MSTKRKGGDAAVPFKWAADWSDDEWVTPFADVDGVRPKGSSVGVLLDDLSFGAPNGFYWFDTAEELAEALCFALPAVFGWDEEEDDEDDEDDEDHGPPHSIADVAPDDGRRVAYEGVLAALRLPRTTKGGREAKARKRALALVTDLAVSLAQSEISWIGTFDELRTADDPSTISVRRDLREELAEREEDETGEPCTPKGGEPPIGDDELDAVFGLLATKGLSEC